MLNHHSNDVVSSSSTPRDLMVGGSGETGQQAEERSERNVHHLFIICIIIHSSVLETRNPKLQVIYRVIPGMILLY